MTARLTTEVGDITIYAVDAIVNAANEALLGGGGVDGAIHRAAGPALVEECRLLGGCPTGQARITAGYNLPARHVIHTVGPVYYDGLSGEPAKLESCYRESMRLAHLHGLRTLAFPAVSCGVYGYPVHDAADIAMRAVREELEKETSVISVTFVLFSADIRDVFQTALDALD